MFCNHTELEQIPHLRFSSFLSSKTLDLLKEQVYNFMFTRNMLDDPLVTLFLNAKLKANEIFLYSDYSMIEFDLPSNFDTLFWKNSDSYFETLVHIPFSIMDGWFPTQTISLGHKHVCLMQFDNNIPPIVGELLEVNSTNRRHQELILVRKKDITTNTWNPFINN